MKFSVLRSFFFFLAVIKEKKSIKENPVHSKVANWTGCWEIEC